MLDKREDDPRRWLGDTPMLNLHDDKLRLRVQTVVQFSRTDDDPHEFARQLKKTSTAQWLLMLARNRLMSIRMSRKVRGLRNEAGG